MSITFLQVIHTYRCSFLRVSYHCDINNYTLVIDDSSKVILIGFCSSINVKGAKYLMLLAYERVGFKQATSLLSLAQVKEVSLLSYLERHCFTYLRRKCCKTNL
jgi:hypothetical protein